MYRIVVFMKRGFITLTSYRLDFALTYLKLFLTVTVFYFISRLIGNSVNGYLSKYGGDYTGFIVIGVTFHAFMSTSLYSFSSAIRSEQNMGTLEFLLMSRTRLPIILLFSALWSFVLVLVNTIVIFLFAIFIYGVEFNVNLVPVALILVLSILTFSGIGMMSAGIIIAFKQGDPFNWIFCTVSGLLGGVYFPVEIMPASLKKVSLFLPNTYALRGIREALLGSGTADTLRWNLLVLGVYSLVTIPAGIALFRWGFNRAREDGSLVEY